MDSSIGMDYALFNNNNADEIEFVNKNDQQEDRENQSKKFSELWKVIVCSVLVCIVICVVFLFGFNLQKATQNNDFCNTTLVQINSSIEHKRQFVKEMMIDAWNAYVHNDWGNEVLEIGAGSVTKFGENSGLSIVASMSTLWIMGLKDEFEKGKTWIKTELDMNKINNFEKGHTMFDLIPEYVGGLLSCYALTSDQMFLVKANKVAQSLDHTFNKSSDYQNKIDLDYLNYFHLQILAFNGPIDYQEEFHYLDDMSGESKYRAKIKKVRSILVDNKKPRKIDFEKHQNKTDQMHTDYMNRWNSVISYLFSKNRKMYISFVKSYIQSNHLDAQSIEIYKEAMDTLEEVKMFEISNGGLYYAREYASRTYRDEMLYSSCSLGAVLSLGASAMQRALALNSSNGDKDKVTQQNRINRHWHLAIQITRTCQQASDRTKTGLGPKQFSYSETQDVILDNEYGIKWKNQLSLHKNYKNIYNKTHHLVPDKLKNEFKLSPELAESNFILWRLTHDEKYRYNAWTMAQAIHQHCRLEGGGYSGIKNVHEVPTIKNNYQPPIFLSATLKYLYLTFTDDTVLPLDQFVFNSVGHPLPICGNNTMYPLDTCKF